MRSIYLPNQQKLTILYADGMECSVVMAMQIHMTVYARSSVANERETHIHTEI